MLRILYSKEWKSRFKELNERGKSLEEMDLILWKRRAMGEYLYNGKYIGEVIKANEVMIEYNREEIKRHKGMTIVQKMRYKG